MATGVGASGLARWCGWGVFAAVLAALCADMALFFHDRWSLHVQTQAEYAELALSEICSDPMKRVRSARVNNCARADEVAEGRALPPVVTALLETLQHMSLCEEARPAEGVHPTNRCDLVVHHFAEAGARLLGLALLCLLAVCWLAWQARGISRDRARYLPLTDEAYPANHKVPPWFSEPLQLQ
jgi:cbb3-type cytochrome oxidase subunit 3